MKPRSLSHHRRYNLLAMSPMLAASVFIAGLCHAQDSTSVPELKQNPMSVLKDFEPPPDQEYELGRGDEITVEVIGRPELSGKHVIGPDGRITLPVAGSLKLTDETRDKAAEDIQKALSAYYQNLTVSVGVDHYTSNQILLLGAVEHPGIMSFDKTPTLLEVISRGGLPTTPTPGTIGTNGPALISGASLRPLVVPETCMIYRGSQTMVTVQLRSLLQEGNPLADMRLRRDDIVYVPGQEHYVSILGQVPHPGTLRLDSTSTLTQLLAEAGGPTDKAGRYPDIQIIHRSNGTEPGKVRIISYKEILQPKPLDLTLVSGDIIYIPENGFNRTSDVLQKMAPLVNLVTVGALLH